MCEGGGGTWTRVAQCAQTSSSATKRLHFVFAVDLAGDMTRSWMSIYWTCSGHVTDYKISTHIWYTPSSHLRGHKAYLNHREHTKSNSPFSKSVAVRFSLQKRWSLGRFSLHIEKKYHSSFAFLERGWGYTCLHARSACIAQHVDYRGSEPVMKHVPVMKQWA